MSYLLSNPLSPSNIRIRREDANSVNESFSKVNNSVIPKFLPALVSPQHTQGLGSLNRSLNRGMRAVRNSHVRLQSLNDRGFNTMDSVLGDENDKVFQYNAGNPVDAQTAHDKLNLMIVRG